MWDTSSHYCRQNSLWQLGGLVYNRKQKCKAFEHNHGAQVFSSRASSSTVQNSHLELDWNLNVSQIPFLSNSRTTFVVSNSTYVVSFREEEKKYNVHIKIVRVICLKKRSVAIETRKASGFVCWLFRFDLASSL